MYYTKDTVTSNIEDPADQFKWMETVLKMAKANNEKVCFVYLIELFLQA
jgi:hypothetical protein